MLPTQVQYWSYKENQRHNLATETQAINELAETTRHNKVYEAESHRHNVATENISLWDLNEKVRHNLETEKIQNQEVDIHRIQARASIMQAQAAQSQAATARRNADILAFNAGVNAAKVDVEKKFTQQKTSTEWANTQRALTSAAYAEQQEQADLALKAANAAQASSRATLNIAQSIYGFSSEVRNWLLGGRNYGRKK